MTDHDLANLQLGIYGQIPIKWDWYTEPDADVVVGIKLASDNFYDIICRGSADQLDWFHDFKWLAWPFTHDSFGPIHPGFLAGIDAVLSQIIEHSPGPRRVSGHSLGAAHARIIAAKLTLATKPPEQLVVWGEPRSGFAQFRDWWTTNCKFPARSYRNGDDPVTFAPPYVDWLEPYVDTTPRTDIAIPPADENWHDLGKTVLAWHNMQLYARGSSS